MTGPHEVVDGEPASFVGGHWWRPSALALGRPRLHVGGGGR